MYTPAKVVETLGPKLCGYLVFASGTDALDAPSFEGYWTNGGPGARLIFTCWKCGIISTGSSLHDDGGIVLLNVRL
jgi:hypothetical protein